MIPSFAFISYSEGDWRLASRLRIDLKRASIDAWTYQHDGEPGAHFVAEYKKRIEASDVFCLLDSKSTKKSEHMRIEARHALAHGKPIYVCLAEPRSKGSNWWDDELFEQQNFYRVFDLTGDDRQYRSGIQDLFFKFGLSHRLPDILLPRRRNSRRR